MPEETVSVPTRCGGHFPIRPVERNRVGTAFALWKLNNWERGAIDAPAQRRRVMRADRDQSYDQTEDSAPERLSSRGAGKLGTREVQRG